MPMLDYNLRALPSMKGKSVKNDRMEEPKFACESPWTGQVQFSLPILRDTSLQK